MKNSHTMRRSFKFDIGDLLETYFTSFEARCHEIKMKEKFRLRLQSYFRKYFLIKNTII